MSIDNTTPRLTRELIGCHQRLEAIIPRIPIVIGRLDNEQPGFPTGHTGSGSPGDGPDRWQTSDPAYCATAALLEAHRRLTLAVAELDRITGNWMRNKPNEKWASKHGVEGQCVSCIRVGHPATVHRGHLCRRCYERLDAINDRRDKLGITPHVVEVPYAAVWHLRMSGKLRYNQMELDEWAQYPEGRKAKRNDRP